MQNGSKSATLPALAMLAALAGICSTARADTQLIVLPGNISASGYDGNAPANTNDGLSATRWSADAAAGPQWIQYQLGGCYNVTGVDLAWYKGDTRRYNYSIQTSVDGSTWTDDYRGTSAGSPEPVPTRLAEVAARYVRIVSNGSDADSLVGLSDARIMTSGPANCPAAVQEAVQAGAPVDLRFHAVGKAAAVSAPGDNFKLDIYTLQLPTGAQGNVATKKGPELEAGFTDPHYFYSGSDGAMVMMDPRVGYTTSGSVHPRTEFRENAIWTTGGTNLLDAQVAVTKVPGNTAIAQIFQGTGPSKPLCELQYSSSGAVKLFLEKTNQGGSSTTTTITTVPLGTKFTYQLKLSGKTITVRVNNTTKTFTMDDSFVGEKFYFKAGNYDQTATQGTPQTAEGTVVKFYTLKITH